MHLGFEGLGSVPRVPTAAEAGPRLKGSVWVATAYPADLVCSGPEHNMHPGFDMSTCRSDSSTSLFFFEHKRASLRKELPVETFTKLLATTR